MRLESVGIIGYGDFGSFLKVLFTRFAPSVKVKVYSRAREPDSEIFFTLEEVCACDAVILAVPIVAFENTVKKVLPLLKATTVLVDVSTVKMHTVNILHKFAKGQRYIASHPMFGPESYAKRKEDVSGFRIVLTDHNLPDGEYRVLTECLRSCGFTVVETTSEKHDRHLAETLFLTHFIGQIINAAGFSRTEIDTVSFGFLMDAADSVRNDTALFQDVFRFNPFCREILDRFEEAERETRDLLEKS